MKFSTNWLQRFFAEPLPSVPEIEELLTFHSSEIEEVEAVGSDTMLDVKVLPDKSAWLMNHRGLAKELSVILERPLQHDPLVHAPSLEPHTTQIALRRDTEGCDTYHAALVTGVEIGESPQWLKDLLATIGQRSINNVVDATNFVMFNLGQPLHAFDADKLSTHEGGYAITVRQAADGEAITTLTGETYTLTADDMVITDGHNNTPIGIAGIKGGKAAEVDKNTTTLLIESAHFDRTQVRMSAQRLRLRTDASARYENGVPRAFASYGLHAVVALITELAGGTVVGYASDGIAPETRTPVTVTLKQITSYIGLELSMADVISIFDRFGYEYTVSDMSITVTPPFERDDLLLAVDIIEEIGRIYDLRAIRSIVPVPAVVPEFNARFYYSERIRTALVALGFSEVYTSSFRKKDQVKLKNAFASDKGYLRSTLAANMEEALTKNVPHKDLLGLTAVQLCELGTVFLPDQEMYKLVLGVRTTQQYKAKVDDSRLTVAQRAVEDVFGTTLDWTVHEGIAECALDTVIAKASMPTTYGTALVAPSATFVPFSNFPSMSRDVALWVSEGTTAADVEEVLNAHAGELRVRTTLFDEFTKDGRTSYAFRLVFQSNEKTLTDEEVNGVMEAVYAAVGEQGWEVR